MTKEEKIEVEGSILEALPNAASGTDFEDLTYENYAIFWPTTRATSRRPRWSPRHRT